MTQQIWTAQWRVWSMPYSSTKARWVSFSVSHTSFPHVWCQVCSAGSRLVVQESVAERVVAKIRERMTHLRLGDSLDKVIIRGAYPLPTWCVDIASSLCGDITNPLSLYQGIDMSAIVDPSQRCSIDEYVQQAKREGAEVYQAYSSMPSQGCFYPPTLITKVQPVSTCVQEEVSCTSTITLPPSLTHPLHHPSLPLPFSLLLPPPHSLQILTLYLPHYLHHLSLSSFQGQAKTYLSPSIQRRNATSSPLPPP